MRPESPDASITLPLDVLDRVIAGEATDSDQRVLDRYAMAHPRGALLLQRLRATHGGAGIDSVRVERMLGAAMRQVAAPPEPLRMRPAMAGVRRWGTTAVSRTNWTGWYAALAAVVGIVLVIVGQHGLLGRFAARSAPVYTTYATGNGERAKITLPDGSRVMLGVASQLQVPMDFAHDNRTLRLVGEALFSVRHERGAPVTVLTEGARTRVLGTTFMVRRYATDSTSLIAVRDGKVAVGSTVLTAGEAVEMSRTGGGRVRPATSAMFSFAEGVLALDNMSLPRAIVELNRWYDADIRLGDSALARQAVRGTFTAGSLADLSANLALTFDARVVRNGRVLTLYSR